ncbi:hypothetical protein BGX26_002745 [Mortierella sp. AD094]|nr:hypothetical protein BGX26_002745 [Mortierella sp. AD094]
MRIEEVNDTQQDIVFGLQHERFKKFMDDKISPFIAKDEPSPPYMTSYPNKRLWGDFSGDFAGGSELSWEMLALGYIIDALQEMQPDQQMGILLGVKVEHTFSCMLKDVDVGTLFTSFF